MQIFQLYLAIKALKFKIRRCRGMIMNDNDNNIICRNIRFTIIILTQMSKKLNGWSDQSIYSKSINNYIELVKFITLSVYILLVLYSYYY